MRITTGQKYRSSLNRIGNCLHSIESINQSVEATRDGEPMSRSRRLGLSWSRLPEQKYMPEVGNGHIATIVNGPVVFMNGLFNGEGPKSSRAKIPSLVGFQVVTNHTKMQLVSESYTLDVRRGELKIVLSFLWGCYTQSISEISGCCDDRSIDWLIDWDSFTSVRRHYFSFFSFLHTNKYILRFLLSSGTFKEVKVYIQPPLMVEREVFAHRDNDRLLISRVTITPKSGPTSSPVDIRILGLPDTTQFNTSDIAFQPTTSLVIRYCTVGSEMNFFCVLSFVYHLFLLLHYVESWACGKYKKMSLFTFFLLFQWFRM